MAAGGVGAPIPVVHCEGDARHFVLRETRIVQLAEQCLDDQPDYERFIDAQRTEAAGTGLAAWGGAPTGTDTRRICRVICNVLGVDDAVIRKTETQVTRVAIACTPYVRFRIMTASTHARAELVDVPRALDFLLAWWVLGRLAAEAGMRDVTYQTMLQLLGRSSSLLWMLAHADCEMSWGPDTIVPLTWLGHPHSLQRYLNIARRLLPSAARGGGVSLGEALLESAPQDEFERAAFLTDLAAQLRGRIVPTCGGAVRPRRRSQYARMKVQRWAMRNLNDELLVRVFSWQRERRERGGRV
jgi:hypothetical protein